MIAETKLLPTVVRSGPSGRPGPKPVHMTESAEDAWKRFAVEFGYGHGRPDHGIGAFMLDRVPVSAGQLRESVRPPAVAEWNPRMPAVFALIVEEPGRYVVIGFRRFQALTGTTKDLFPAVVDPDDLPDADVWPFLLAQRDAVRAVLDHLNPDSRIHADGLKVLALAVRLMHRHRDKAPSGEAERQLPGYDPDAPPVLNERGLRSAILKKVNQIVAEEIELACQGGNPGSEPWESPFRGELLGLKERLSERLRTILHWSDPDVLRRPVQGQSG
jgi:hypothetical protein